MYELRFDIAGEDQYHRAFSAFGRDVANLREPLTRIRDLLIDSTGRNFQSEGGGAGGWAPLNPSYDAWKQANYPGRPMLVLTGAMRGAFLDKRQSTLELTDRKLVWGVDTQRDEDGNLIADRAFTHQRGEGHMPRRKIVALTFQDRRAIDHEIVAHLNRVRRSLLGGRL